MRVSGLLLALLGLSAFAAQPAIADDQTPDGWRRVRDTQDGKTLELVAAGARARADKSPKDANLQYLAALATSLHAEVLMEQRDKKGSSAIAESGMDYAKRAVEIDPYWGEYHRLLGTLCAQTIPGNVFLAMRYGHCALDEVNKAIQEQPKSSIAWLSKGVGNYYLPAQFGGGPALALDDIKKAIALDGKNADAWLWQGIVLRKLNRDPEARKSIEKALALSPGRVWAKQQLEKTPQK
jgi:tetratricopeptide (TPR) repeat protein